jgi:hypothetical protein
LAFYHEPFSNRLLFHLSQIFNFSPFFTSIAGELAKQIEKLIEKVFPLPF